MGRRGSNDDVALLELARLNILASIEFDPGMLYSPQDLEEVTVALSAPSLQCAQGRKLRARISVIVEAE